MPIRQEIGKKNTIPLKRLTEEFERARAVRAVQTSDTFEVPNEVSIKCVVIENSTNLSLNGGATVDGRTIQDGDVVAVNAQTSAPENGVYVADTAGDWTRVNNTLTAGGLVAVLEGTTYADTLWLVDITSGAFVIGTDDVALVQVGVGSGGTGLEVPENTLFVSPSYTGLPAPYYDNISDAMTAATGSQSIIVFTGVYDERLIFSIAKDYNIFCIGDVTIKYTSSSTLLRVDNVGASRTVTLKGAGLVLGGGSETALISSSNNAGFLHVDCKDLIASAIVLTETSTADNEIYIKAETLTKTSAGNLFSVGGHAFTHVDITHIGATGTGTTLISCTNANSECIFNCASFGDPATTGNAYIANVSAGKVTFNAAIARTDNNVAFYSDGGEIYASVKQLYCRRLAETDDPSAKIHVRADVVTDTSTSSTGYTISNSFIRNTEGVLHCTIDSVETVPKSPFLYVDSTHTETYIHCNRAVWLNGTSSGFAREAMIVFEGGGRCEISGNFQTLFNFASGDCVQIEGDGLILRAGTSLVTTHASANSIISNGGSYTCYAYGDSVANASTDGSTTVAIGALNVNANVQ